MPNREGHSFVFFTPATALVGGSERKLLSEIVLVIGLLVALRWSECYVCESCFGQALPGVLNGLFALSRRFLPPKSAVTDIEAGI